MILKCNGIKFIIRKRMTWNYFVVSNVEDFVICML